MDIFPGKGVHWISQAGFDGIFMDIHKTHSPVSNGAAL